MRTLTLVDIQKRIENTDPEPLIRPAEARARASIEETRGSAYTDAEWREAKNNLSAFFVVLAEWEARRV